MCETGTSLLTAVAIACRLASARDSRAASTTIQPWHKAALRLSITSTRILGHVSFSMAVAVAADS
ncbi:MAG: hypothetical protein V1755_03135 [Chloroflexota bacterium]